jgi:hypothetical protein
MRLIYCLIVAALFTSSVYAQKKQKDEPNKGITITNTKDSSIILNINNDKVTDAKRAKKKGWNHFDSTNLHKKKLILSSSEGITIEKDSATLTGDDKSEKNDDKFHVHWCMLDLGINTLQDKTDYNSTAAQSFLQVPANLKNSNLFNLNQGKSVNVNVYPIITKYRLHKSEHQRIYLMSGLGLQLYNFRFEKPIAYNNRVNPQVFMDSINFKKNKLAFDYLMIPLELVFKTKVGTKNWLVYGFGITGGYRLNSWMKQESSDRGKQKDHDKFNFRDFNSCIMGEIGLDGYVRLYATYQLTSLQENALNQYPFAIGIRFMGI